MKISRRSDIDSEKLLQELNLEEFFYGTNQFQNDNKTGALSSFDYFKSPLTVRGRCDRK
jgi:hypothetical protein